MPEEPVATDQPKPLDIYRILTLARRRQMHFLLPLFLGWLVVWSASWFIPAHYKSTTTILVQQLSGPQNYVTPNIGVNLQERLASLTQQILSRTRLLTIANRLHLYGMPDSSIPPDDLVRRMRKDIHIELVRPQDSAPISGFTVSYSATSPQMAQSVTQELTGLFIQSNQQSFQRESEDTTRFLQDQLTKARASLSDQESKVRDFQSSHLGALPAQQAGNLQILAGLQAQLQSAEDSLNAAQQQQVYLQSLIEQYDSLHASNQASGGAPADLLLLNTQLASMRTQLDDLKSRYTDRYPTVQALQDKIDATVKERNQLIAALNKRGNSPPQLRQNPDANATLITPDTSPTLLQLRSQLVAAHSEIATRRHDIERLKGGIAAYQSRLNAEPAVASELSSLTQTYQQAQATYTDLLKKEKDSAMATSMEQMQQGQRFSVLDSPSLPIAPDSPNRLKMSLLGIVCGLVLGVIVAGTFEYLDDRLYSDKDIEDLLPVALIGEIPEITTDPELKQAAHKRAWRWATTAFILILITGGSMFSYIDARGASAQPNGPHTTHHV